MDSIENAATSECALPARRARAHGSPLLDLLTGALLTGTVLAEAPAAQQFGPPQLVAAVWEAELILAADLDGDGDADLLVGSDAYNAPAVAWYENTDALGSFQFKQGLAPPTTWVLAIEVGDLDLDGDLDVLGATEGGPGFAWYENTDGAGAFGPPRTVVPSATDVTSIDAVDLNGDGHLDLLTTWFSGSSLAWYENADGLGGFGSEQSIATSAPYAQSASAADMDCDGDLDVLANHSDLSVAWYENLDGLGSFGPEQFVTLQPGEAGAAIAADLDGDGDQDVLAGDQLEVDVYWYPNLHGSGVFGQRQLIDDHPSPLGYGPRDLCAVDLDRDGDLDVLSGWNSDVAWSENLDGQGTFGPHQVIAPKTKYTTSVGAADLDGDGDADVVSAGGGLSPAKGRFEWSEAYGPGLNTNVQELSLATGGTQKLVVSAPAPGQPFLVLGSLSGTLPGVPWDGLVLPLNVDGYLLYTLANPGAPPLAVSAAVLDSSGRAYAAFTLPAGLDPGLAGVTLHHAAAIFDLFPAPGDPLLLHVSNAVLLTLAP